MSDLFLTDELLLNINVDPMFIAVRDLPDYKDLKVLLETLFAQNKQFIGDPLDYYRKQLAQKFEDIMWSLCLMGHLAKNGFQLQQSLSRGPDIKALKDGKIYWIEAVNVSNGMHVQNPVYKNNVSVEMGLRNEPRVISRLTSAIQTKAQKFLQYIPNPVHQNDMKIIAVSAHKSDRARRTQNDHSFMEITLFDEVEIDNPNGQSTIQLGLFRQAAFDHIDQIIYCPIDILTYFDNADLILEWYDRSQLE